MQITEMKQTWVKDFAHGSNKILCKDNGNLMVKKANVYGSTLNEIEESMNLISAAPDLLLALKGLLDLFPHKDGKFSPHHYKEPLRNAMEAVEKAEGKK